MHCALILAFLNFHTERYSHVLVLYPLVPFMLAVEAFEVKTCTSGEVTNMHYVFVIQSLSWNFVEWALNFNKCDEEFDIIFKKMEQNFVFITTSSCHI